MPLTQEFVLASESPRRKLLLEKAGVSFTVFPVKVSENLEKNLTVQDQIQRISSQKWQAARVEWNRTKDHEALLLTADTMVVFQGQALGKPKDSADAVQTLERLSGHSHRVITAISLGLSSSLSPVEALETTEVYFRLISRQEILDYVASREPMDKAGSYAIQENGGKFVEKFVGSYDNIVGLPVELVKRVCHENGWELPASK